MCSDRSLDDEEFRKLFRNLSSALRADVSSSSTSPDSVGFNIGSSSIAGKVLNIYSRARGMIPGAVAVPSIVYVFPK